LLLGTFFKMLGVLIFCGNDFRGLIKGRVGIEHRPAIVDRRRRFGDWESDILEGAKHRGYLATHVERKSRYLIARKLANKQSVTFAHATIEAFRRIPQKWRKTMTADNGKEFAKFKDIEKRLGFNVYFARPYAAWERGANENTNGLLRQFFPKGSDFSTVTALVVAKSVRILNNRPRKCLGYRTPREVLFKRPIVALRC
jgi:IS30 family transposase